jgi:hypothetical protein
LAALADLSEDAKRAADFATVRTVCAVKKSNERETMKRLLALIAAGGLMPEK